MEEFEDDGTWIWISFASEHRLVLAHAIGERKQTVADKIIEFTKNRLASMPLFVTDGLKFYPNALLKHYGKLISFPLTGRRGRPKRPKVVPQEDLRYAQIIKQRENGRLKSVIRRVIFGDNIDLTQISTSLVERLNLTLRQDNNRLSRKTLGFSKKLKNLSDQMTLYFANYNFCRGHGSLRYFDNLGKAKKNCPAKDYGLIDHNWSLRELMVYPCHIIPTH